MFGEGEAEAVAGAGAGFFGAVKAVEDVGEVFFGNAGTLVTDGKFIVFEADCNDRFLGTVFDGVFDEDC